MKKRKMFINVMILVVAAGTAFAFKVKTVPGNLWYFNSDFTCVAAPCATFDQGPATPCAVGTIYLDDACGTPYTGDVWVTECGNK